jgi:hypothetical protein
MRGRLARNVILLIALSSGQLAAKVPTRKLILWGGRIAGPIEIIDPATLALSDVFTGTFLDTARGVASPPTLLPQYTISFYLPDDRTGFWQRLFLRPRLRRAYVVRFALDTLRHVGYVYVPGDSDVWAVWNRGTISRRQQEGHWNFASAEWTERLAAAISRARPRPAPRCSGDSARIGPRDSTYNDAMQVATALESRGVNVICAYRSTWEGTLDRPGVGLMTAFGPSPVTFFASARDAQAVQMRAYIREGDEITEVRAPGSARVWTFASADPSDFIIHDRWLIDTFGQKDLEAAVRSAFDSKR